jgi:hypothetical protein
MQKVMAVWIATVIVLSWSGAVDAHHSLVQFDTSTPVWLKGRVVRFDRFNPHSRILVDQAKEDGHPQRWAVDGPAPNALARMGIGDDFLKPGDAIEVCGFVTKEPSLSATRPISGHLLVMPDGKRRFWSDYGVLQKCLKPGENKETLREEAFGRR